MGGIGDRIAMWAVRREATGHLLWVGTIATALLVAWMVAALRGQPTDAMRHLFYLPVLVAAFRYRTAGAVAVAVLATALAGPLAGVPATAPGNSWQTWGVRGLFFLLAGVTVAVMADQLRRAHQDQDQQARTETDLRMVLIQTLSHELRTPVTVLRGYLDTVPDQRIDPATRHRLTTAARRALDRLQGLAVAVATCAGATQVTDPEWVDLHALAAEVHEGLESRGAHDRVTWDLDVHAASLNGSTACRFALTELVTNALKHTPGHTPVHVRVDAEDDHLILAVRDHGSGIPDDDLAAATAPLRQLDGSPTRRADGIGLGLFATRKIVDSHHGRLELINHPDAGLTATVRLPLADHTPPTPHTHPTHPGTGLIP